MKLQIIYKTICFEPSTPDYHNGWLSEMDGMREIGLDVSDKPDPNAERLLYRSPIIYNEKDFPSDSRFISRWEDYNSIKNLSEYFPLIEDITIPSFITDELNDHTVIEINRRGWKRAFVRSNEKSLKYCFPESHTMEDLPIWPEVSMDALAKEYNKYRDRMKPPYIVRKFMPENIMQQEERYWVLNNHIYHRSGIIPFVVEEAAQRLRVLNVPYYVIDATPEFIVELNPGVSSDAYPENIPDFFPQWIKKEFG